MSVRPPSLLWSVRDIGRKGPMPFRPSPPSLSSSSSLVSRLAVFAASLPRTTFQRGDFYCSSCCSTISFVAPAARSSSSSSLLIAKPAESTRRMVENIEERTKMTPSAAATHHGQRTSSSSSPAQLFMNADRRRFVASATSPSSWSSSSSSLSLEKTSSFSPSQRNLSSSDMSSSPGGGGGNGGEYRFVTSKGDYGEDDDAILSSQPTNQHQQPLSRQPLYSTQPDLPHLPVPDLEETIGTFLPTAVPLANDGGEGSEEDVKSLREACQKFPEQAAKLQDRLIGRKEGNCRNSSWLQEWWNREVYLKVRDPLFYVSYYYRCKYDFTCGGDRLAQAAAALHAAAVYGRQVKTGSLPSEKVGRHSMPLCSSQFKYLFNGCRVPGPVEDAYRIYLQQEPRSGGGEEGRSLEHAVVACRGQFYSVRLTDHRGAILSRKALRAALEDCLRQSSSSSSTSHPEAQSLVPELGLLTTTDRDTWAETYAYLHRQSEEMREALEVLQSSLGIIALDFDEGGDEQRLSDSEHARRLWHGDRAHSSNRWMDKSFNVCVNRHGQLGYVGEHSMMDGLPAVSLCCQMMDAGSVGAGDPQGVSDIDEVPEALPVFNKAFSLLDKASIEEIRSRVNLARSDLFSMIEQHDLHVLTYRDYGSARIKRSGLSPDAFVQQAMQLASFRLWGQTVGTYEAVQTRKFLHGRTETARSTSIESKAFVKAMCGNSSTDDSQATLSYEEKVILLRAATDAHTQFTRKAVDGRGVDRHFFGLSMILKQLQEVGEDDVVQPDLLSHPLYVASKTWRLTTSQVPRARCGFAQVEKDGIGIGYDIERDDEIAFSIHGRKDTQYVEGMVRLLREALDEMEVFLEQK